MVSDSPSPSNLPLPSLSADWIDGHAYGIVKALQKAGFTTYLVGGCVRDLLIGRWPKDFDIATSAQPNQVKKLIYMSFVIGKRFRLVLVKRGDTQFEVATFRREINPVEFPEGAPDGDNVFGSPEEDALRRDFTINALFYDPIESRVIDYAEGLPDIQARLIRMIGDPPVRLKEDSIRILRALRLAHLIGFRLEPSLREALGSCSGELAQSVLPRRREEILKILKLDEPERAIVEGCDLGIWTWVLPTLQRVVSDAPSCTAWLRAFDLLQTLGFSDGDVVELYINLIGSLLLAPELSEDAVLTPLGRLSDPDPAAIELFLKDELGAFRHESAAVLKCLELLQTLSRTEEMQKRGERRQAALVKPSVFPLALKLAQAAVMLTPAELNFWLGLASKHPSDKSHTEEGRHLTRKAERTRRGGRRGGRRTEPEQNREFEPTKAEPEFSGDSRPPPDGR
jgi:poly(A) polymerase